MFLNRLPAYFKMRIGAGAVLCKLIRRFVALGNAVLPGTGRNKADGRPRPARRQFPMISMWTEFVLPFSQ